MDRTKILSIDTSGQGASLALACQDGSVKLLEDTQERHKAEGLMPLLSELLRQTSSQLSDIRGIVLNQGPGGFTGLRVACGTAQGLACGLNIGVLPIGSLEAMAFNQSREPSCFLVARLDARMQEYYFAVYSPDESARFGLRTWQEPSLIAQDQLVQWLEERRATWESELSRPIHFVFCDQPVNAQVLAEMALTLSSEAFVEPEQAQPLYVRNKVAFTSLEREQGAGGNPQAERPFNWAEAQILPMSPADVDEVVQLEALLFDKPWTKQSFLSSLDDQLTVAWVVRFDAKVIAYLIQYQAPDVAHVLDLGVSPAYQGLGIAQRLLALSHEQALKAQLTQQILEVRTTNMRAIDLYRRQGYQQIGLRKDYYGIGVDAWVLCKQLV